MKNNTKNHSLRKTLIIHLPATHSIHRKITTSMSLPMALRSDAESQSQEKHEKDPEARVEVSRVVSARPNSVTVPRNRRRGLFGRFSLLAEVEDATTYSNKAKWFVTFVIAMAGIAAPFASAIIFRMCYLYCPPFAKMLT